MKKLLTALFAALLFITMLSIPCLAASEPLILFTTNGQAGVYAPGAVMLARGWVGEESIGVSGTPVLVVVKNTTSRKTIYSAEVDTDSEGFFTTNFNLGTDDEVGDTISINISVLGESKSGSFMVGELNSTRLEFLGSSIQVNSGKSSLSSIPLTDTSDIALVFTANVNFFKNSGFTVPGYSDVTNLALNERNADCVKLYNDATGKEVDCTVDLAESDSIYGNYYQCGSSVLTDMDPIGQKKITDKNVLHLKPNETLVPGTVYRINIDGDLSANNSASLGLSVSVYFRTELSGGSIVTPGNVQGTPAQDLATIKTEGQNTVVAVDAKKALAIINDNEQASLVIDLTAVKTTDTQQKVLQLPQEVVTAAQTQKKDIVLQEAGWNLVIPADALAANQAVSISTQQVELSTVPAPADEMSNPIIYEFNAGQNGQTRYNFRKEVTISLPIPTGVTNPERLVVCCLNETTGQWEYVGGRIVGNRLVFRTGHFSKYMLALSTKTFTDISSHWAKATIEVMAARQIATGVSANKFAPDRNITRAEFATLLIKALNLKAGGSDNAFRDVAKTDWYAEYVSQAAKIGLISGYAGQFRPNDQINRQEMASMVMRAYNYKNGKSAISNELTFVDKDAISPWAAKTVKDAYNIGIIKGRGEGKFAPLANATRAEATTVLKTFMDALGL